MKEYFAEKIIIKQNKNQIQLEGKIKIFFPNNIDISDYGFFSSKDSENKKTTIIFNIKDELKDSLKISFKEDYIILDYAHEPKEVIDRNLLFYNCQCPTCGALMSLNEKDQLTYCPTCGEYLIIPGLTDFERNFLKK